MSAKHTPGPWRWDGDCSVLWPEDEAIICDLMPCDEVNEDFHHGEITAANGRLIAAAPDLLEACRSMVEAAQKSDPMTAGMLAGCALHMAGEAIAKATGGQP